MFLVGVASHGEVKVVAERTADSSGFKFKSVPLPARNDSAAKAHFKLVDGEPDRNGGELTLLHDGRVPSDEDQPSENFFFRAGTDGGRIQIDLGSAISVKQVNSYSWHSNTRAPQVYKLYAAEGTASGFNAEPKRATDPEACGWKLVARVDTRPQQGDGGGQHGVAISDTGGALGKFRYWLLDISRTEERDAFGNTFYSEIDVIDAEAPEIAAATPEDDRPVTTTFEAADGKYQFTMDATVAPDLMEWADNELRPVVQQWYPKLVAMLPSDGYEAPTNITLRFRNDMRGTPASASGGRVNMNSGWFRRELKREARGSVVHELVHVVQNYGRARRTNPDATRTPSWLVEGIPDYIRWFLYEPEVKGAEITERNLARAKYDASYRITGNFLNWVTAIYDKDIVRKLNAAAREGKYTEQLWKDYTGKTAQELGDEWKKAHEDRLGAASTSGVQAPETELELNLRSRVKSDSKDAFVILERKVRWEPKKTALIICDMWDDHWCKSAARRVAEMAGPLNEMVKAARARGVFVIHAPSTCTGFYDGTPQRRRAQVAPFSKAPIALATSERWGTAWCWTDPKHEAVLPIDDSDMGCDCLPVKCAIRTPWTRQISAIEIAAPDAVTDHGQETWNLLAERGIENVILCGVHLNMCVLGRPFAIRQMVKLGKNVALTRDMTDTMYNPERPPGVSHFAGTDLVIEHVEKYWCPSFISSDVTGRAAFRFQQNNRAVESSGN